MRRADPPPGAIALLCWVGRTYADEGDVVAAADCYAAALATALAHSDRSGVAHVVALMASAHRRSGALEEADQLLRRALKYAEVARENELAATIEEEFGVLSALRGDLEGAQRHLRAALAGMRRHGLSGASGCALNHLGSIYVRLQRWSSAERCFDDAALLAHEQGDVGLQIALAVSRAEMWISRRRYSEARLACDLAMMRAERSGDRRSMGETYRHYGMIARELGDYAAAERHFDRALALARERSDLRAVALTAREQAELFWRQDRNRETLRALTEANRVFTALRSRRDLRSTRKRLSDLEAMFLDVVRRWGETIESKDLYTRGHCDRVAGHVLTLAQLAGVDADSLFWYRTGAMLHDVGKLVVPSAILNKPGPLDAAERAIMETHPAAGVDLLDEIDFPWDVRPMIRHHHERWDGTGYPDGLSGDRIPLEARILCVADVWDALTTDRPYRAAFARGDALAIMRGLEGRTFDPELLELFLPTVETEPSGDAASSGVLPFQRAVTPRRAVAV